MSAREVKTKPCENCEITQKTSAVPIFVNSADDWITPKTDLNYESMDPCYIKYKLKNPELW